MLSFLSFIIESKNKSIAPHGVIIYHNQIIVGAEHLKHIKINDKNLVNKIKKFGKKYGYYFEGNSPPFVTYTANQADINYWGMNFVVIGYQAGSIYGPVMVSYTISQVAGPGECTSADPPPPPPSPRYDCINGSCLGFNP